MTVDIFSCVPLHLELRLDNKTISQGTGFVLQNGERFFLITNKHVVTGRRPDTNLPLSPTSQCDPDHVRIWLHRKNKLGEWIAMDYPLLDSKTGIQRWIEHKNKYDVVALPINFKEDCTAFPLDISLKDADVMITPSDPVSIIGFPFGKASDGKFAIWKTGHVASDIDLDYDQKPVFLIDARTKPAMSGSPVIARRSGSFQGRDGTINIVGGGQVNRFLGVYSGRLSGIITELEDIGMVWKPSVLIDILKDEVKTS